MDRVLKPLPPGKRRELELVVEMLQAGFADALKRRTGPRKDGRLLKIILFGSYARGNWVDDPIGRYFSDYDILVVVDDEDLTDIPEFWDRTEKAFLDELATGQRLRTPVSLIVHTLDDVNDQLQRGRYFFVDIKRDGIVLFEEPGHPLVEPKELAPQEALAEARGYYQEGISSAQKRFDGAMFHIGQGNQKDAAFDLHQTTERLYNTLFLTLTLYTFKSHNLNRLRTHAERLAPELQAVWPNDNKFRRRAYERLREAYVKARYSSEYHIADDELAWLAERIEVLQQLVKAACQRRLAELARG